MAYQVYFANLAEENKALSLALLRLKEEAGGIEPNEAKLLEELRGSPTPWPQAPDEPPMRHYGRNNRNNRSPRRGPQNGRAHRIDV